MARGTVLSWMTLCLGIHVSIAYGATLEREQYLMGTRLMMRLQGAPESVLERASSRAFEEVARLEAVMSNWRDDSEISRLNRTAGRGLQRVSPDLFSALEAAGKLSRRTAGSFDATVEPLLRAYDLRGEGRIPSREDLLASLEAVGADRVRLDSENRTAGLTDPGAGVDLGGIGKGIALDRIVAILRTAGVPSGLINFGGEVYALGESSPGESWRVELADPSDRDHAIGVLRLRDAAVSTSGQSERSIHAGGVTIGHILDPHTGAPVPPWGGVTVVSRSAADADGLSTALFVMGPDAARAWADAQTDMAAILVEESAGAPRETITAGASDLLGGFEEIASAGSGVAGSPTQEPEPAPGNAELARRIDILSGEIEKIKLGEVAGPPPTSVYGLGPAASKVYGVSHGVSVGGYGEMLYQNFSTEREDGRPSEKTDQIDFVRSIIYVGYKYDEHLVFNSEIEFEHSSTEEEGSVSVEFATLDYRLDPKLSLRAGLLLVPVGMLNELHEPPIYLGARRPDVEQNVIPSTWRANGAGIVGELPAGLRYRAYLLEGLDAERFDAARGIREGRQAGSEALAKSFSAAARLDYESPLGFLVGGSVYSGPSGQAVPDSLGIDAPTTLLEAHGQYRGHGLQVRALHARVSIDDVAKLNALLGRQGGASIGERIVGSYVEAGYDLLPLLGGRDGMSLIPFGRFEMYNTQDQVPDGFESNPANERKVLTLGAAFNPHPQVVLKADWQKRTNEAETGVNQWNLAAGYLF